MSLSFDGYVDFYLLDMNEIIEGIPTTEWHRTIYSFCFYLRFFREYTLEETALSVGLTKERIRQMEMNVLYRIRHKIEEKGLCFTDFFETKKTSR